MKQPTTFPTIEAFIEHLKARPDIVGILQYGNRDYRDMSPGGDFDLNVILREGLTAPVAGIHLHAGGIPVDCGLMALADLRQERPPSDYHCVLVESVVLYDRTGDVADALEHIRGTWRMHIPPITEARTAFERFVTQHVIDKLEHRLYDDEVYSRVLLSGNIFWLLENYIMLHRLNPYGFREALAHMRDTHPQTYALFRSCVDTHDLAEQLVATKKLSEAVLRPVGGRWKEDELLFHYADMQAEYTDDMRSRAVDLLF